MYRQNPKLPSVYDAGVKYRRERGEHWRHVQDVLGAGWGDCEDLATARAGELRARGGDPRAKVVIRRTGPKMTHAIVQRGDGTTEDPSRRLGMGKEQVVMRYDDDDATAYDEDAVGADVSSSPELTWTVAKTPDGWKGTVRIPLELGRCALVTRGGKTKQAATSKALDAATGLLDSPAVRAAMPAPARLALALVRSPKLKSIAKSVLGMF